MSGIKRTAADKWCSDAVRMRDGLCLYCGKGGRLEAAHILGRRSAITRWSLDNLVSLCSYHHRYFTENPTLFHKWLEELWGPGHLDLLHEKHRSHLKNNDATRKEVAKHYREEVRKKEQDSTYEIISWN